MFRTTLAALIFVFSSVTGKPLNSEDWMFESLDGITVVRDRGAGWVGIATPLQRRPVYIRDDYDESVCPEIDCDVTVKLMTFWGVECEYCVIKEGEQCSDTRQFSLTNTKANCEEGLTCLPSQDKFTCQVETVDNTYKVESFRNLFDKDTVPMKYADSETPCKDHFEHWEKILHKRRKHWRPVCDASGYYDVTKPQCTEDMMCWCVDKRGRVTMDDVTKDDVTTCNDVEIFAKY